MVQHGGMYRQRGRHSPANSGKSNTSYIDNKKIGTAFEDLGLPNAFYFFAAADEPNHEGSGLNGNVSGIIKWDDSNYDPNSYEEQTIYGEVNRAEFESTHRTRGRRPQRRGKDHAAGRPGGDGDAKAACIPVENGDFTLPDNTMSPTGDRQSDLRDGSHRRGKRRLAGRRGKG